MGLADPHNVRVLMHHREFQGVDAPEIVRKPETAAQDCATARDPLLGQRPLLVRRINCKRQRLRLADARMLMPPNTNSKVRQGPMGTKRKSPCRIGRLQRCCSEQPADRSRELWQTGRHGAPGHDVG